MNAACIVALTLVVQAGGWWNADWSYRLTVHAKAAPVWTQNAILRTGVNFGPGMKKLREDGGLDSNSIRVTWVKDGKETEVPSRLFNTPVPNTGIVCWLRPGEWAAGAADTFHIYFDSTRNGSKQAKEYPEMVDVGPGAGKNLLLNSGFEEPAEGNAEKAANWSYQEKQRGGTVECVKDMSRAGNRCLRLTQKDGAKRAVAVRQRIPVEPGRRYEISGWVKFVPNRKEGHVSLTAMYAAANGSAVAAPNGQAYKNYKVQTGSRTPAKETPWFYVSSRSPGLFDPIKKAQITLADRKTVPGTGRASVSFNTATGDFLVYFDDVELRELPEVEPVVRRGAWQRKP